MNSICGVIDLLDAVKSVVFLELKSTVKKKIGHRKRKRGKLAGRKRARG